ncbi:MAG TPA: group 1 truncated hemoglobin [Acidimicrobiales bacterium]|jgi:hemoglobin|nr:group 1 truncated hemoglobin [Acidimicrobiales bacterium]
MAIYEQIGGSPSVAQVVDLFYEKVVADPTLAGFFDGVDMRRLKGHQRAFIAAALGGAEVDEGRDVGAAHAELVISDDDFDAVVGHLAETLDELGGPASTIGQIAEALAPLRDQIVTFTSQSVWWQSSCPRSSGRDSVDPIRRV